MEDIPKATHDTTPTSTAPPPTRRGLLAGAGLILAAAAVTAATVAESPDAELLAECERFIQGEADYGRLCRAADFSSDETITPAKRAVMRSPVTSIIASSVPTAMPPSSNRYSWAGSISIRSLWGNPTRGRISAMSL
jgi:hypothetical protein